MMALVLVGGAGGMSGAGVGSWLATLSVHAVLSELALVSPVLHSSGVGSVSTFLLAQRPILSWSYTAILSFKTSVGIATASLLRQKK